MTPMLSVQEAAVLLSLDERQVRRRAAKGDWNSQVAKNERNRPMYLIPLTEMDARVQKRYYDRYKAETAAVLPAAQRKVAPALDSFTAEEREEIAFWMRLTQEWQTYRAQSGASLCLADEEFEALCRVRYPERSMSIDTIRRRWSAVCSDDLAALVDQRGKHRKGKTSMNATIWDVFLSYYLDEAKYPVSQCMEYTETWAKKNAPELLAGMPDYTTFTRRIKRDVPDLVELLGREGEKAYRDRGGMYIRREYENMASNEWWICDNHTLDIISKDDSGTTHRLYLTAFFDARSGIFTGCYVTTSPSSQSTLIALRRGILEYGIPENILGDNGREFLTFDMGGLGHRQRKPKDGKERFSPPPIFQRLGINFTTAQVRNARAKTIERAFLNVKNQISRLFATYTGGNVTEKPERLKEVIQKGTFIPTDKELTEKMELLLRWYFNEQPYGGAVAADRGKPRMQVYNERLSTVRKAGDNELHLMLMRSTRAQKVGRRGVHVDVAGQRMEYLSTELKMALFGKQVYLRYDPDDMSSVRVYDLKDRFIMTVPSASSTVLTYGANHDELTDAIRTVRAEEKYFKKLLDTMSTPEMGKTAAIDMALAKARFNREAAPHSVSNPQVLDLQRATEQPLYQKAVGSIDLDRMTQNAMKRRPQEHE